MDENAPAEIYANVRNKALEDAARVCDEEADGNAYTTSYLAAARIRALKTEPA